ncbi:sugar phosphate isomerase/epimerase family protein [Saccharomonospora xinjiangensis]|uniref:sugar phosphate isomerase/epimerase family protein n=1 Tax=Saccharomonospora xinjiangensis TaxID=75294 RepID=UPI00350F9590
MRLGCVVRDIGEAELAAAHAVDYLELKGDVLCAELDELRTLQKGLLATGVPVETMTSPLPRRFGCRVVGPDADHRRALEVFRAMTERGGDLGVRMVVLGSGQARTVRDGFPVAHAETQFRAFVEQALEVCRERHQHLTVEPLHRGETNFVNSCAEARAMLADLDEVMITADCYHIVTEELDIVAETAGRIAHAHTSSLPRGSADLRPDVQAAFVAGLRAGGHDGGLTLEDSFDDPAAQLPTALETLRRVLSAHDSEEW